MSNRVRLLAYEAEDVHRVVQDYIERDCNCYTESLTTRANDLVNTLADIHTHAMEREIQSRTVRERDLRKLRLRSE